MVLCVMTAILVVWHVRGGSANTAFVAAARNAKADEDTHAVDFSQRPHSKNGTSSARPKNDSCGVRESTGGGVAQPLPEPGDPLVVASGVNPYPDELPQPVIPWDYTEQQLDALKADALASSQVRGEAAWLRHLRFPQWRGRDARRLGGFEFDLSHYPMLEGWQVKVEPIYVPAHKVPPVGVQRDIDIRKGAATLNLRIYVAVSAGWAHSWLAERIGSGNAGTAPVLGDDVGVGIGDVCLTKGWNFRYGHVTGASFWFAQRNVVVEIRFEGADKGAGRTLDVMKLAELVERQIRLQGHDAKTWADLKDYCPLIKEFSVDDPVFKSKPGLPKPVHVRVEPRPGMVLEYCGMSDGLVMFSPGGRTPSVRLLLDQWAQNPLDKVGELPATAWLFVVDKNSLLFSVAKLDLTLTR